jgi:Ran GTPase-activating protein (RanGAP) involved in mRNA processing and transport
VLGQRGALAYLNLSENGLGDEGASFLASELPQCRALPHLDLSDSFIGSAGAESLAGMLGQCER